MISVSFTVELANEVTTTTTTSETTAETTAETTVASSETTVASSETTATSAVTTATTAEEKGVKKITVGKTYSELLKDAQKADPKEGMIGWKWADFGITNSNVVKKVVVNVSSDKEIGTYNYMFGSSYTESTGLLDTDHTGKQNSGQVRRIHLGHHQDCGRNHSEGI